jgi:putative tryptophan/tyrosine transport system substrate-binding protein
MKRREFIVGLVGAEAWLLAARAQQPRLPAVGFINIGTADAFRSAFAAFHHGLAEAGFVEGRNLAIEYRYAQNNSDGLPELAADLFRRRVDVIVTAGSTPASLAAKAATTTIPIVFGVAADPVQIGLVSNLNRPGGNVTGFSEMNTEVGPKRFGLLHELIPKATRFGVLVNPKNLLTEFAVREARAATETIGRSLEVLAVGADSEIETVFASLTQKRVEALVITPDGLFMQRRNQITALAARYAVPAIYWDPLFPEAGGLMSYGSRVADSYREIGIYVGRILKGEKPGDLPVLQPTKFELVINHKTAMALGLDIPPTLLAIADEVIE